MPLPAPDVEWPPKDYADALATIAEWAAWYSGDPEQLISVYGGTSSSRPANYPANRPSQYRGGVLGRLARLFWGPPSPDGEPDERQHVDMAGSLAAVSAGLLFADPPTLAIPEDLPKGEATALQARLDLIAEDAQAGLLEGAEIQAGLGGVYPVIRWDTDVQPDPWLAMVHADGAIPEWRYGKLLAATLWRVIEADGNTVVRHLERHARGVIEHGVYEGTSTSLGQPRSLTRYTATADLEPAVETGTDLLTVGYVPNLHSRAWRSQPGACWLGRSDYAGSIGALAALDQSWTSLMRDLDLARARAMVPSWMLDTLGPGQGAAFAAGRRYFVPLNMSPTDTSGITTSQPEIRAEEHLRLTQAWTLQIIGDCGYSPETFGLPGEVAMTATESGNKRARTLVTGGRKGLPWRPELARLTQALLAVGNKIAGWGVAEVRPTVKLADVAQTDPRVTAEIVNLWTQAEAASTETKVRTAHPEWDDDTVTEEVARIVDERSAAVPAADAFGQPPTGDEPADEEPAEDPEESA